MKIKGASAIDQFTLRKYIFIQSLVALPDFSDKNLIISKLRKKYTNGFKENSLEFNVAIYKNNPNHICLMGIRDFALLRSKIRSGIVWSLSKSNPSNELNRILNKLPCYIAYNEIRKLTGELLDEYEKEDAINKIADDTRKAFIDSLLDLKMKPSKRRKLYRLMVKAFKEKFELHKWARVPQNHIAIRKSLRDAVKSGSSIEIFEDLNTNNDVTKTFLYNLSIKLFKMIDGISNDLKIVKQKYEELEKSVDF